MIPKFAATVKTPLTKKTIDATGQWSIKAIILPTKKGLLKKVGWFCFLLFCLRAYCVSGAAWAVAVSACGCSPQMAGYL